MQKNNGRELPLSTARLIGALCGEYIRMQGELLNPALDSAIRETYRSYTSILLAEAERCRSRARAVWESFALQEKSALGACSAFMEFISKRAKRGSSA